MKLEFTTILRKIGFLHENKNLMPLIGLTIHLGKENTIPTTIIIYIIIIITIILKNYD